MKPKVTILSITYNQGKFIGDTLESFMMQKTDFDFQVIIHDDASTDNTLEIIKDYQKKYPGTIKVLTEKKNRYSQGDFSFIESMLNSVKGDYLIFCEGDDYWTDPNKLQIQADFLDNHPDYSVCFHPVKVVYENKEVPETVFPESKNAAEFNLANLLKANFIQTNSVMYRKQDYTGMNISVMPGDWYQHLYHCQFGKIGFIDKVMSVYRRNEGSVWWDSDKKVDDVMRRHGLMQVALFFELLKMYGDNKNYREIILQHSNYLLKKMAKVDDGNRKGLLYESISRYPEIAEELILSQESSTKELTNDLAFSIKETREAREIIEAKNKELELIKTSKTWKLRSAAKKLKKNK